LFKHPPITLFLVQLNMRMRNDISTSVCYPCVRINLVVLCEVLMGKS
jgi:hypothetical protein